MGVFANVAQQNTENNNSTTGGLFARLAAEEEAKKETKKDKNNLLQKFAQNVLVRPAIRAGQTVGALAVKGAELFMSPEQKALTEEGLQNALQQDMNVGLLGTTKAVQSIGQGGGKQIALEGGKSALDIATIGTGSAINAGLRGVVSKATIPLAEKLASREATTLAGKGLQKAGQYALKQAPGVTANATEGLAYNTAYNALNEKPLGENAGLAVVGSVAVPAVIRGISKAYTQFTPKGIQQNINKELDTLFSSTRGIGNKVKLAEQKNINLKQELSDPQLFKEIKVNKGKIDTTGAVDKLDNDIEIAMGTKKDLLPELDRIVPEVSRETLRKKAIEDVGGQFSPADEQEIIQAINRQVDALPEVLKPSEVDALRAKFRTSARDARGIQKRSSEYSALENATRNTMFDLTDNLPFDTNKEYQALNNYIRTKIETKNFLEKTLQNQTVKGGRLNRYALRTIGAVGGLKGGFLGSLAGAEAGGIISDIIVNNQLGSSMKMRLIKNITDDPEVIKKAEKLLSEAKGYKVPIPLKLPAGAIPLGGVSSLGQKLDASGRPISPRQGQLEVLTAKKNPVTINPKTGKFQTSYSSTYSNPSISRQNTATKTITIPPKTVISKTIQNTPKKSSALLDKFKNTPNKQGGFATGIGYKETGNLTTKILKDLEGKTTVSKQYILDATNRGELKQVERDITRQVLDTMKGDTINVKEFADKVKSELLPLEAKTSGSSILRNKTSEDYLMAPRYENISLPAELRGKIKDYRERIYNSPIETSAGKTHFGSNARDTAKNYFGHTRIEDMADNKTRRVIEVQSDLYQKGNLEREIEGAKGAVWNRAKISEVMTPEDLKKYNKNWKITEDYYDKKIGKPEDTIKANSEIQQLEKKYTAVLNEERVKSKQKLQQYNDPTAHFRMVREEIKRAAQDGKTKLQFPTGETAMKIEGLGERPGFYESLKARETNDYMKPENLKIGKEIINRDDSEWIITDVLGDGKFKAVPKDILDESFVKNGERYIQQDPTNPNSIVKIKDLSANEEFDISGKIDTNNPIYRFYEKDVQKYLNKFGGKRVVDDKGVSWIEIPITKEQGKAPVEAFGKVRLGTLQAGALVGLGGAIIGGQVQKRQQQKEALKRMK